MSVSSFLYFYPKKSTVFFSHICVCMFFMTIITSLTHHEFFFFLEFDVNKGMLNGRELLLENEENE